MTTPTPEKRTIQRQTRLPLVLLLVALAALLGFAVWRFAIPPQETPVPPVAPAPQATQPQPIAPAPQDTVPAPAPEAAPVSECDQLAIEIKAFFTRLDQQEYIAPRKLPDGSHAYIAQLVGKLLANPPVVAGETDNLFTILSNTAHFYRILKKDDVLLVKDILLNESENIEPLMALFYRWSLKGADCPEAEVGIKLPLPGMYEYAGFFLNTLGGRSYLFRRESRLRMLVKYYSILTLDRANDQSLNKYGIDIRPSIDSLIEEMRSSQRLTKRDHYLADLIELQDRYQQQYGGVPQPAKQ